MTEDEDFIKQFSSFLKKMKSDNIGPSNSTNEHPLYVIYIKNGDFYPGGGISIYKGSIEYKDRIQNISSEELSSIIKLIEKEIQEGKK